jgi:hypothetical protein
MPPPHLKSAAVIICFLFITAFYKSYDGFPSFFWPFSRLNCCSFTGKP